MSETDQKPLFLAPEGDVGYSVKRRDDGGMELVFTNVSEETLEHWRKFALAHLIDSDRLTRNLYDLRQIDSLPEKAIQYETMPTIFLTMPMGIFTDWSTGPCSM